MINIPISELSRTLCSMIENGYGMICMFAVEPGKTERSIDTVLRKGGDLKYLTTELPANRYESISETCPWAIPYETEMKEMNGLDPVGLEDRGPQRIMRRYVGGYPLMKGTLPEERKTVPLPGNGVSGEGVFEIPVGPVHAGVIEPGHFRFSVAGEPMFKVRAHLGYTHRGVEKMMETNVSKDNTRLTERICGDSPVANSLAYAHIMEGDAEIPIRAQLLRVIFSELERIYCHITDITGMATDTGFSVPSAAGSGIKEKFLRLNETIGGHRFLMGSIVPGGVRRDISDNSLKEIKTRIMKLRFDMEELMDMLTGSIFFMDRVETTGTLRQEDALAVRAVGPTARASGISSDVRKELPYDAYADMGFRIVTECKGDVYSRLMVKSGEITESASIIGQCLDNLDRGPLKTDTETKDGMYVSVVEAPRGELMHAARIVDGEIWRYKIRDPSFVNWSALEYALPGNIVPDFPLINKSFNLSYSGNDL